MAQGAWAELAVGNEVNIEELPKEEILQYTEMCIIEQHCVSQSWILEKFKNPLSCPRFAAACIAGQELSRKKESQCINSI